MSKRLTVSKVYQDVYEREKQLARELAVIQKSKVSIPELRRRIINLPDLKAYLFQDAELKRRLKK